MAITGEGGTMEFPINAVGWDVARRVASILVSCSPDFTIQDSLFQIESTPETPSRPFAFDWSIRISTGHTEGRDCSNRAARWRPSFSRTGQTIKDQLSP